MEREIGDKEFPIWLLGDSNPSCADKLKTPLDPRHPSRHNIWTPILDGVQDRLFRDRGIRLDTSDLYIRNAIENAGAKLEGEGPEHWGGVLYDELKTFRRLLKPNKPPILITFGAFSYEFARRALDQECSSYGRRRTPELGRDFRAAVASFELGQVNVLPLLNAAIARGRFIESHEYFSGGSEGANYFDGVADGLAKVLARLHDVPEFSKIWIQPRSRN